jgi:hypothetical protein
MKGFFRRSLRSPSRQLLLTLGALLSMNLLAAPCERAMHSLLGGSPGEFQMRAPKGVHLIEAALQRPSGQRLASLRSEQISKIHYVVTADGQMHFLDEAVGLPPDRQLFAKIEDSVLPVREGGVIRYEEGRFVKTQRYGFDLSAAELQGAEADLRRKASFAERLTHSWGRFSEARVMDCSQGLRNPPSAKEFVLSKLSMDLALMTGSIMILAPERFDTLMVKAGLQEEDPNRNYDGDLLAADYSTSTTNTVVKGIAGFFIASRGLSIGRSLGYRIPVTATSIGLQTLVYGLFTDNNAGSLGAFNAGYSVFSMVKSHYVDRFMVHQLPNWVLQACIANPKLRIFVSQGSIRLAEGLATSVLYMGARRLSIGE